MRFWGNLFTIINFILYYHIQALNFRLVRNLDHDHLCFTQGLYIHNGFYYESCGMYGESSIRKVEPLSGRILWQYDFDQEIFAEGLVIIDNYLYVLTWKNNKVFLFDIENNEQIGYFLFSSNTGEGWGLASDGKYLILSDGGSVITFYHIPIIINKLQLFKSSTTTKLGDLIKFKEITITHNKNGQTHKIKYINELEYANNYIYANIWYQDIIIEINSITGNVENIIDLKQLYTNRSPSSDVCNGIAYNHSDRTFVLTGKYWPKYYIVTFNKKETEF